jgi:hypothetical protein
VRLEALHPRQQRPRRRLERRLGRLHQGQLELGAGVGAVLHRAQRGGDQIQEPHDLGRRDAVGLLGQALVVLGRDGQLGRDLAERARHQQRPGVGLEVAEEALDVAAGLGQPGGGVERGSRVALRDRVDGADQEVRICRAQHGQHVLECDRRARVGDELLQGPERVAEGAGGGPGDQRARLVGNLKALRVGHPPQHGGDLAHGGAPEVEPVAAVHDRGQDLVRLGRGEDEDRVRRRLLERLEERVPGRRREHVRLVEDVDLVAA